MTQQHSTFAPRLEILPAAQRALWTELAVIPPGFVLCGGPAVVSFFGVPSLRRVAAPLIAEDYRLRVASLLDLAGMKAAVVQRRAEAKDYIDLHALLVAGIGLPMALAAARIIYGERFNPQLTLKALSFFGDGDLPSLPLVVQERIIAAVRSTDLDHLPMLPGYDGPTD